MFLFTLFLGFLVGVLTIIAVEAVGVVFLIGRLSRKSKAAEEKASRQISHPDLSADPSVYYDKQGVVWVLEPEKVPKSLPVDKVRREQKRKKETFEVIPVRKYAQIKDQSLILTESDSSHTVIHLKDCTITAVSATAFSSRKWAKRYPIKVESRTSALYNGSKTAYIYLETSWEKESWCKALRIASCNDTKKLEWFSKTFLEFQNYLTTLNTGYPSFMKPSAGFNSEPIDRSVKLDGSSSKVRLFLKKIAKKASKSGVENKMSWTLPSGREERKFSEKFHSFQDSVLGTGVGKTALIRKASNFPAEDKIVPSLSTLSHTSSRSHVSMFSDADSDDKIGSDEGTLCWNLLISRLFFDAKGNTEMKKIMQARIQRTLSNTRTPSYIGDLICTSIDLGTLPPCISGMRVLPLDMNEVWALEIDIQYSGGALLDIKTRLEVREPDFEKGIMDTNLESSSDLLEGFEYYRKQLELSGGTFDSTEGKVEADSLLDGMKSCKSTNKASRWKSILNSVAKQVSQVPLSLAVRVASLRGTLRLHIKPPPSDQLWFGFTSMPDIDFNLESCVGEHKIKSGHIALFLINRFKAAIRDAVVLPNCTNVCIPWMLAEKDDWVPLEAAPYIWINHEAAGDTITVRETPSSRPGEVTPITIDAGWETTTSSDFPEAQPEKGKNVGCFQQQSIESSSVATATSSSNLINESPWSSSKSLQELSTPLLSNGEPQATCEEGSKEHRTHPEFDRSPSYGSFTSSTAGEQIELMEGDDVSVRPKRMAGTRARMLGLGKKMGEKLEEKRRNFEEKGRHIVERMRGPP